jgi:hypothetical protein
MKYKQQNIGCSAHDRAGSALPLSLTGKNILIMHLL